MKAYLLLIGLLLILPIASGCSKRKVNKPHLGEVERLPRLETIVLGEPAPLEVKRSYTATLAAFEKADLCAMVKGYLDVVPSELDIGAEVKRGQILLTMYVPDLIAERDNRKALSEQADKEVARAKQTVEGTRLEIEEAKALVRRSEADNEFRKVQHIRIERLAMGDALSKQQLDEAKLQVDIAQAAFLAAQAQVATRQGKLQIAEKEQEVIAARLEVARSELKKAQVQVDFATLRAPFDGIITRRPVDSGTTVKDAGMPLFTFMRTDKMRVIIDIPERDAPYFQADPQGNKVVLHLPALQENPEARKITGTVTRIASALDPVTRTMRVEMHLDNKIGDKTGLLKPQMTGTAEVILAERHALTVPASALVRNNNKLEIYVVENPTGTPPRGIVKRLEVQIGLDTGKRVEIRHDYLTGRELVIVKGAGMLRPGDEVIAVQAKAGE
jgi:HlyD family secretion protein